MLSKSLSNGGSKNHSRDDREKIYRQKFLVDVKCMYDVGISMWIKVLIAMGITHILRIETSNLGAELPSNTKARGKTAGFCCRILIRH